MTSPDTSTVRELVRLACLAPSVHNTQPWAWLLTEDDLQLHAATSRQLRHTDASGRDLVISCGAALHQLVVAAAGHGWSAEITRMPDPEDPRHLASVTFTAHVPDAIDASLLKAIAQRRTDRRQVSSWEVPPGRVNRLITLAARLGVVATAQGAGSDTLVRRLLREAAAVHDQDEACQAELLPWVQPFPQCEGMPMRNLLTASAAAQGDGTRFPFGSLADDHTETADPCPTWLVLATASDDALSWLRVGEALDAIWLACTVAGLLVVPYSEPIEVESTRAVLRRDVLVDCAVPHLLLRVGWPPVLNPVVPPTPRRALDDVLTVPRTRPAWRIRDRVRP